MPPGRIAAMTFRAMLCEELRPGGAGIGIPGKGIHADPIFLRNMLAPLAIANIRKAEQRRSKKKSNQRKSRTHGYRLRWKICPNS